jgi:chromosomal replication initiation ATPase DnaA
MRAVDTEPTYADLVEINRKYLALVVEHHPELAHMVPTEMLTKQEKLKRILKGLPKSELLAEDKYISLPDTPMSTWATEIAEQHDISVWELIGESRSPLLSRARGEFIVACREREIPYTRIGDFMSGRNFSTIMHHEKKYLSTLQGAA